VEIYGFIPRGYEGLLVRVEVDVRRGIPGVDIVGLAGSAVVEARERVRVAYRNSGLEFPRERILVNLAPADVKKTGAVFDLAIAMAIGAVASGLRGPERCLVLGELELSGNVRPVTGVLAAVAAAALEEIEHVLVPAQNFGEATALGEGYVQGVSTLVEAFHSAPRLLEKQTGLNEPSRPFSRADSRSGENVVAKPEGIPLDFSAVRGQPFLRRALELACAGGHHVLLFGPPGCGKTMSARRVSTLMPRLTRAQSLEVTRIHSLAGALGPDSSLLRHPPVRMPHHTASLEGMIGGGRPALPGEASLAHHGVLVMDEAGEFRKNVLQSLREPLEEGLVRIVRAGQTTWFPASFQLVMATNPCPCGNLGSARKVCVCDRESIRRYWRKIGGALLDRIDIRIPVRPPGPAEMEQSGESSAAMARRVASARARQLRRYGSAVLNGRAEACLVEESCKISPASRSALREATERLSLSSRAYTAVLRIARTIADLEGSDRVEEDHLLEAIQHRRYGEGDLYWNLAG
jgi:magnesium chelatase family protein